MGSRAIEKKKLEQLENNLKAELKKTPKNRQLIKTLRQAILIQKDLIGE